MHCLLIVAGAVYGTVEGCFIKQVPSSTTPMMIRALGVIVSRSVLVGELDVGQSGERREGGEWRGEREESGGREGGEWKGEREESGGERVRRVEGERGMRVRGTEGGEGNREGG